MQLSNEYLTSNEVAVILRVSRDTIIRKFHNRKGVIDLGKGESRFKRRYRVLRIPTAALKMFVAEASS